MKRSIWTLAALVSSACVVSAYVVAGFSRPLAASQSLPPALARAADPVINTLWNDVDRDAAMGHVRFASQYWRLAGNPGYDATIDRVRARLTTSGFAPSAISIDEYPNTGKGWSYSTGTLAIVHDGRPDEPVLSREKQPLSLCINSFSTPPAGVVAPLVDVGKGAAAADYAGKNLKGAVVLGDAPAATLWRNAVVTGGAIGVISTQLAKEVSQDPDILQWGTVPYDEARRRFAFKSTARAAAALRQALGASTNVSVRVTTTSTLDRKSTRLNSSHVSESRMPSSA